MQFSFLLRAQHMGEAGEPFSPLGAGDGMKPLLTSATSSECAFAAMFILQPTLCRNSST